MQKNELLQLLKNRRFAEYHLFRKNNPEWRPDLSAIEVPELELSRVDLSGADLRGADLTKATWRFEYIKPKIAGAIYDLRTKWPLFVDPAEYDAVLVSMHTPRPIVFISYASMDKSIVEAIDQWLREHDVETRIDSRDFFAGSRIRDEILRVMVECDTVLVFYSAASKDRPWPTLERELAADLEIEAKSRGGRPPRIMYVVIGDLELPSVFERGRLAIFTRGKLFAEVCDEICRGIRGLQRPAAQIDLSKWMTYRF